MTPRRLLALITAALGRKPTEHELETWGDVLACPPHLGCPPVDCVHDTEAEQALRLHRRNSPYPATPSDIHKIAIDLANRRLEAAQMAEHQAAVQNAVPPTAEYLAAKAEWDRQQELRRQQLEGPPETDEERAARRQRAREAADAELAARPS